MAKHEARRIDQAPGRARPLGSYLAGVIAGLVVALGVGVVVVGPMLLTHRQDLPLERLYGRGAVSLVARLGAASVPAAPASNPRGVEAGRSAYTGSCSQCHGATGDGKGAFGQSSYPPATDLTSEDTQEKSDAELFWIVQNGLSFTGMPSFRGQYQDQDIWNLVGYLRTLKGGQPAADVPAPTAEQLAMADPKGDAVHRGAAVYFAQNCAACHGAVGNAPGELALRERGEASEAIRRGRRGMPAYGPDQLTDAQLADLQAYMGTFPAPQRGFRPG
jgi:mono/diheme cytochrome c family protein